VLGGSARAQSAVDGKSLERLRSQCPQLATGSNCAACLNLDVAEICTNECGICSTTGRIPYPSFPGANGVVPSNLAISLTNTASTAADPNSVVVSGGIRHGQNLVDLVPRGLGLPSTNTNSNFYGSNSRGNLELGSYTQYGDALQQQNTPINGRGGVGGEGEGGRVQFGGLDGMDTQVIEEYYAALNRRTSDRDVDELVEDGVGDENGDGEQEEESAVAWGGT